MSVSIPLLEMESESISQHISGITTITFYYGNIHLAAESLKERFTKILKVNPWLRGRLLKKKGHKKLELIYDETADTNIDKIFKLNPASVKIHSNMSYSKLGKASTTLIVQKPTRIINKEAFVTKLTLVQDTKDPSNKFSLIFSLSHSVGDGHTYYSLLNMLCKDAPIYALNVHRKENLHEKAIQALGKKEYAYLSSFPHVCNIFKGLLFGKRAKAYAFYLDEEKISQIKEQYKNDNDFVSTNDILSSTFANFIGARLCSMAINFRGRVQGLINEDAGNYEGAIIYDEEHYKDPLSIRKSLCHPSSYLGLDKPLPKVFEGMFCKMGLITNWASFAKELKINACEEYLHLPLTNTAGCMPYEMCVVFRVKEGKTGVIYFTQRFKKVDFNPQNIPIAKLISEKIFA